MGVAIPGEPTDRTVQFQESYAPDFDYWIDVNSNFQKLIKPGGRSFPLDVVINRKGIVTYLENDYIPGEAIKAVEDALKE